LLAIVDLTENSEVTLWPVDAEIYSVLGRDEKTQQYAGFFSGTLESIASHMLKDETPEDFFKRLMMLPLIAAHAASPANSSVTLMPAPRTLGSDGSAASAAAVAPNLRT
jgi:hypothetical protein